MTSSCFIVIFVNITKIQNYTKKIKLCSQQLRLVFIREGRLLKKSKIVCFATTVWLHDFVRRCYNALWKITHFEKNSKCVKFGTKSTHFEFFFQKCVNISHINARNFFLKIIFCMACFIFYSLKISKTIIDFKNDSITSNILSTILLYFGPHTSCIILRKNF